MVVRLPPLDILRFEVSSRTSHGVVYEVIIEPQQPDDPYLCTCPRFTKHTEYHGQACHHIREVVAWVQENARPLSKGPGVVEQNRQL